MPCLIWSSRVFVSTFIGLFSLTDKNRQPHRIRTRVDGTVSTDDEDESTTVSVLVRRRISRWSRSARGQWRGRVGTPMLTLETASGCGEGNDRSGWSVGWRLSSREERFADEHTNGTDRSEELRWEKWCSVTTPRRRTMNSSNAMCSNSIDRSTCNRENCTGWPRSSPSLGNREKCWLTSESDDSSDLSRESHSRRRVSSPGGRSDRPRSAEHRRNTSHRSSGDGRESKAWREECAEVRRVVWRWNEVRCWSAGRECRADRDGEGNDESRWSSSEENDWVSDGRRARVQWRTSTKRWRPWRTDWTTERDVNPRRTVLSTEDVPEDLWPSEGVLESIHTVRARRRTNGPTDRRRRVVGREECSRGNSKRSDRGSDASSARTTCRKGDGRRRQARRAADPIGTRKESREERGTACCSEVPLACRPVGKHRCTDEVRRRTPTGEQRAGVQRERSKWFASTNWTTTNDRDGGSTRNPVARRQSRRETKERNAELCEGIRGFVGNDAEREESSTASSPRDVAEEREVSSASVRDAFASSWTDEWDEEEEGRPKRDESRAERRSPSSSPDDKPEELESRVRSLRSHVDNPRAEEEWMLCSNSSHSDRRHADGYFLLLRRPRHCRRWIDRFLPCTSMAERRVSWPRR